MLGKYILNAAGEPVPCADVLEWARWYETADRKVARTDAGDGIKVSTVFLGLDHNFGFHGPPILWETMVFGGAHNEHMRRYATRGQAVDGHNETVLMVKATLLAEKRKAAQARAPRPGPQSL